MEARVGIEPTIEDLQSSALPLGDRAITDIIRPVHAGGQWVQVNYLANFILLSVAALVLFNPASTSIIICSDWPIVKACQSPPRRLSCSTFRRSGRVVECDWLEISCTWKGTGGSNPSFSANLIWLASHESVSVDSWWWHWLWHSGPKK